MPSRRLRVFVLGSFRDLIGPGNRSIAVLRGLVRALRSTGFDAFLSGDRRSLELAGASLAPRQMTEVLEPLCDLALYVGVLAGRGDGWVSELVAMEIRDPGGANKRVLLLESGYPLSSILDPHQQGYLADHSIMIATWVDESELHDLARDCAFHMARYGRLPPIL